jgi:hypothetical protein
VFQTEMSQSWEVRRNNLRGRVRCAGNMAWSGRLRRRLTEKRKRASTRCFVMVAEEEEHRTGRWESAREATSPASDGRVGRSRVAVAERRRVAASLSPEAVRSTGAVPVGGRRQDFRPSNWASLGQSKPI